MGRAWPALWGLILQFALLSCDIAAVREPRFPRPLALQIRTPEFRPTLRLLTIIPEVAEPRVNLGMVHWTTPHSESVSQLAKRWGMPLKTLRELNPHLPVMVDSDAKVLVYRKEDGEYSRSVGAPHHGFLRNAVPFPEGPHWELRPFRHRAYATSTTVTQLVAAMTTVGETFPEMEPFSLGEFSKRRGGRVPPHRSHRTGRDVDIGYLMFPGEQRPRRWARAKFTNFDGEKNWAFIKRLLDSGTVENIAVDHKLQSLMLPWAFAELTPEELPEYFSILAPPGLRTKAHIVHWKGHDDHMHVRFACTPADDHCR